MLVRPSLGYSRRRSAAASAFLPGLMFTALLTYAMVGTFPIAAVEGDGLGIANGAAQIATIGREATSLAYRYNVQSGTYALTVFLHKLTGVETFTLLSLLSALAAIVFILVSAALLSRMTKFPFASCGLALLLFQEAFTSAYYANSTVIAASFFVTAFWVVTFGDSLFNLLLSGILLGVGSWMRFDLLLVTPAILPLLHQGNWPRTLVRTAGVAVVTGITALLGLYLSGSGIRQVLASAGSHRASLSSTTPNGTSGSFLLRLLESNDLRSHVTFFTALLALLIVIGIIHLVRKRDWRTGGFALLGSVPCYIVYLGVMTTPKYLYYLIPFAALLALSAFSALASLSTKRHLLHRAILLLLGLLFVAQYITGWQFSSSARPYLHSSFPNVLTLFSTSTPVTGVEEVALVIGAGSSVSTGDGRRLLSGIAFAPLFQWYEKTRINIEVERFNSYLDTHAAAPLHLLTTQYGSQQMLLNLLLRRGYDCRRMEGATGQAFQRFDCAKGEHEVSLTTGEIAHLGREEANRVIDEMLAALQAPELILVTTDLKEREIVLSRAEESRKINDFADEIRWIAP
ncbi:MAG: hypothetical protein IT328_07155 [Caldilineaceae bacterium]|nr:hypothetical protein [Caldilineaceae bacterium]